MSSYKSYPDDLKFETYANDQTVVISFNIKNKS